jgi:hypothetical protein
MVAVAALPGCVPKGDITLAFDSARFNERIRADFSTSRRGPKFSRQAFASPRANRHLAHRPRSR